MGNFKPLANQLFYKQVHIAPLAVFRFIFGACMLFSIIRFWYKGWITDLYVTPNFYFTFYGFDWVKPLGETGMHLLFVLIIISALLIMLGLFYRLAIIIFFVAFTYVELIDKTNYLNHYYFVSLISFLLCWLPAHRFFSIDVLLKPSIRKQYVSAWCINVIKFQLTCVYFFAGIAKINSDWLMAALPLKIWLPAKADTPIIGDLLQQGWVAYAFSWAGCIYDLTIAFFLMYKPTRVLAYLAVIGFHIMTAVLFQIGMFPYIMILATLIFFSADFHLKFINIITKPFRYLNLGKADVNLTESNEFKSNNWVLVLVNCWLVFHVLMPFRYLAYPEHLFWHEQGYRFSWRVMLMEKAGYASFYITDPKTERFVIVDNNKYLTTNQIKMMSTQPDMILQYAHFLAKKYQQLGIQSPEVRAEVYVTLNGEPSKLLIDKDVDLTKEKRGFSNLVWVLPYREK